MLLRNLIYTLTLISFSFTTYAQVTLLPKDRVNTTDTINASTLKIIGEPNNANTIDGFKVPTITKQQLNNKIYSKTNNRNSYSPLNKGTFLYITDINVDKEIPETNEILNDNTLYHFDGEFWRSDLVNLNSFSNYTSSTTQQIFNNRDVDQVLSFQNNVFKLRIEYISKLNSDNTLTILKAGYYTLNAYFGWNSKKFGQYMSPDDVSFLAAKIQKSTDNGITWSDVNVITTFFTGVGAEGGNTIILSPVMEYLNIDDKIRMVVNLPTKFVNGNTTILNTGVNEGTKDQINVPNGHVYSKSITIDLIE